jgi:hypothetical protein
MMAFHSDGEVKAGFSNSHFAKITLWERLSAAKSRGEMPLTQHVDAGPAS